MRRRSGEELNRMRKRGKECHGRKQWHSWVGNIELVDEDQIQSSNLDIHNYNKSFSASFSDQTLERKNRLLRALFVMNHVKASSVKTLSITHPISTPIF